MDVLVTDGATNKALAVVRALAGIDGRVGVTSRFPVSPAGLSRHADASHRVRDTEGRAYVDRLDRVARESGYDQLLPVGGRTFGLVSEYRDRLSLPVDRILPGREVMDVAVDKRETHPSPSGRASRHRRRRP